MWKSHLILCFDTGVCECVEIFITDNEARDLTFNPYQMQTLLSDLPVPVQALYISDAIYLVVIVNIISG